MKDRVKVVVTGAAGQISYSLIPRLVDGNTFGDRIVDLELVEIPQVVDKLEGLVMELEDSNFPNMGNVNYTSNFEEAAQDADWFLLVGSIPRGIVFNGKKIEERADLLQINGGIFVGQGQAIGKFGKPDAKILVVGNPANTNALIGRHSANNDSQLWMAMTMLDSSRARSVLSKKLNTGIGEISKMIIWGNHSPTMYPDFENVVALDTVVACENPTMSGDCFSAAVMSDGSYDLPEGIICGMPMMTTPEGKVEIVRDIVLSDFAKEKIKISTDELIDERSAVEDLLK